MTRAANSDTVLPLLRLVSRVARWSFKFKHSALGAVAYGSDTAR
jgi:hypothetical protein